MAPFPAPIPAPAPAPMVVPPFYDNVFASRAIFKRGLDGFEDPAPIEGGRSLKDKFKMDPYKTAAAAKLVDGRLVLNTITTVAHGASASVMVPDVTKLGQVYAERKMLKALVKGRKDINKMAFNSPEHGKATTSDNYLSPISPADPRLGVKPGTKPQGNAPQQPMRSLPPSSKGQLQAARSKRMFEDLIERKIDQLD